jgi:hypothetical protein
MQPSPGRASTRDLPRQCKGHNKMNDDVYTRLRLARRAEEFLYPKGANWRRIGVILVVTVLVLGGFAAWWFSRNEAVARAGSPESVTLPK